MGRYLCGSTSDFPNERPSRLKMYLESRPARVGESGSVARMQTMLLKDDATGRAVSRCKRAGQLHGDGWCGRFTRFTQVERFFYS